MTSRVASLTWRVLKTYHQCPPIGQLPRAPAVQQAYNEYRRELGDSEALMRTLKKNLFGGSYHRDALYRLVSNDYPYALAEHKINHDVLWFNPNLKPQWLVERWATDYSLIDQILRRAYGGRDFVYYRNRPNNSSVSGILHYQVFYLK